MPHNSLTVPPQGRVNFHTLTTTTWEDPWSPANTLAPLRLLTVLPLQRWNSQHKSLSQQLTRNTASVHLMTMPIKIFLAILLYPICLHRTYRTMSGIQYRGQKTPIT